MSTFGNSVNCLYPLPQCGGWCCHRCWAPLSQRRQQLERSHHEKHSLECKFLLLKPCLRQEKMPLIFINSIMEIGVWFQNKRKLKIKCIIFMSNIPFLWAMKCCTCVWVCMSVVGPFPGWGRWRRNEDRCCRSTPLAQSGRTPHFWSEHCLNKRVFASIVCPSKIWFLNVCHHNASLYLCTYNFPFQSKLFNPWQYNI